MYKFINAESTVVVHTPTGRCLYLDKPSTIHIEAYIKWRDGWTETVPANGDTPAQTIIHAPNTTDAYVAPPPLPPEEVKARNLASVRSTAQSIILAKYPLWVQSNYALGIYSQPDTDVMKAAIASVITESNRLEDAITAGTPATPNWPTI